MFTSLIPSPFSLLPFPSPLSPLPFSLFSLPSPIPSQLSPIPYSLFPLPSPLFFLSSPLSLIPYSLFPLPSPPSSLPSPPVSLPFPPFSLPFPPFSLFSHLSIAERIALQRIIIHSERERLSEKGERAREALFSHDDEKRENIPDEHELTDSEVVFLLFFCLSSLVLPLSSLVLPLSSLLSSLFSSLVGFCHRMKRSTKLQKLCENTIQFHAHTHLKLLAHNLWRKRKR